MPSSFNFLNRSRRRIALALAPLLVVYSVSVFAANNGTASLQQTEAELVEIALSADAYALKTGIVNLIPEGRFTPTLQNAYFTRFAVLGDEAENTDATPCSGNMQSDFIDLLASADSAFLQNDVLRAPYQNWLDQTANSALRIPIYLHRFRLEESKATLQPLVSECHSQHKALGKILWHDIKQLCPAVSKEQAWFNTMQAKNYYDARNVLAALDNCWPLEDSANFLLAISEHTLPPKGFWQADSNSKLTADSFNLHEVDELSLFIVSFGLLSTNKFKALVSRTPRYTRIRDTLKGDIAFMTWYVSLAYENIQTQASPESKNYCAELPEALFTQAVQANSIAVQHCNVRINALGLKLPSKTIQQIYLDENNDL